MNSPRDINLLTVCTETYPVHYAKILIERIREVSDFNITPYCLTDRPEEVRPFAQPLSPKVPTQGWWNKVLLFDPDIPPGWNLYMDLDIVITQSFDEEICWAIDRLDQQTSLQIACVSDAIHWMGNKFSSSLMIFRTGRLHHIYQRFIAEHQALIGKPGGDQVWTGPQLGAVLYMDETFPQLKHNMKFHIAKREGNVFSFPSKIDASIKLIDCGGRPKPHELQMLSYIRDHWQTPP